MGVWWEMIEAMNLHGDLKYHGANNKKLKPLTLVIMDLMVY